MHMKLLYTSIYILTEAQWWLSLGCCALSSFFHSPRFPISEFRRGRDSLEGDTLWSLGAGGGCSRCVFLLLQESPDVLSLSLARPDSCSPDTVPVSQYDCWGLRQLQQQEQLPKRGDTGELPLPREMMPPRQTLWIWECNPAHILVPGEDSGFSHCCNFPVALKPLERRCSAALGWERQMQVGFWCSAES